MEEDDDDDVDDNDDDVSNKETHKEQIPSIL
jgi:hypothetical protein